MSSSKEMFRTRKKDSAGMEERGGEPYSGGASATKSARKVNQNGSIVSGNVGGYHFFFHPRKEEPARGKRGERGVRDIRFTRTLENLGEQKSCPAF